ncbi:MAG: hypothetical protein ABIP97_09115 [Chthoniobacterales bacterium]
MKPFLLPGWICLAIFAMPMPLLAQHGVPTNANQLVEVSPLIAIISIARAPHSRMNDASTNQEIFKQRIRVVCLQKVRGDLPKTFLLENDNDSALSPGTHLAFLRKIDDNRYILTTPVSLRRIEAGDVYWFDGPTLLSVVLKEIQLAIPADNPPDKT